MWSVSGSRKRGRPVTRWTDSFNQFFKSLEQADDIMLGNDNTFWMTLAQDEASWSSLEEDYVNFVLGL